MAPVSKLKRLFAFAYSLLICAALATFWGWSSNQRTWAVAPAAGGSQPGKEIKFNRDIRPILSDRCFSCHGPDANKRQSGLRLDQEAGMFAALPKHPDKKAFVPGKPDQSYAYQRIISKDKLEKMPPVTSHLTVSDREADLIKRWIEQGAKWQEHWSFTKPVRTEPPAVKNQTWVRNDIDRFVLARLEEEGLQPSPEADKATLIRRVSLDLNGIPPSLAEVDAFVKDASPEAYEKLVDRLLASPRYGEQMAAQWLDYARYADSHGFQSDPERFMTHWRDWVINAYNANMPFDEFTKEQMAGDLLPNATDDQKIATGFHRNHRINSEGGVIDEEWRVETVIDRVETTSATFLGLTMGCCRCHDHKFDPVTQKEFYSFYSFFNNVDERGDAGALGLDRGLNAPPLLGVYQPEDKKKLTELKAIVAESDAKIAKLQERVPDLETKLKAEGGKIPEPSDLILQFALDTTLAGIDAAGKEVPAKFEGKVPPPPAPTTAPATAPTTTTATATAPTTAATTAPAGPPLPGYFTDAKIGKGFKADGAGASINAGEVASFEYTDPYAISVWVNLQGPDGGLLSKMDMPPTFTGFDIYIQGNRVAPHIISNWPTNAAKVAANAPLPLKKWVHVAVTYDGSSKAAGIKIYYDGKLQDTTVEADSLKGSIKTKAPLLIGTRLNSAPVNALIDDVRFYKRVLTRGEVAGLAVSPDLTELLAIEVAKRTPDQKTKLANALLAPLPEYAEAETARGKPQQEISAITGNVRNTTMVMQELPKPRDAFVLIRGEYDKHGEKVEVGIPAILPPLPKDAPKNRLGLAQWLTDPANPLVSRVQANRFWEKLFGVGIVKSSEDFGTQSEMPSHPELLDWLATEMIRLKWDLKAFQKTIVMSAAYRQSSNVTPEMLERDPDNRLVAHGRRLRLPAEAVRDQALAVSGLLVEKIGGPSVKPYAPANIWEGNVAGNLGTYTVETGPNLYRRSLYTFLKRTAAPPNMMVFDMPSREYCLVKRSRTNTPLQALDLMNDTTYVEAARMLAQRTLVEGGATPSERLSYAFRRATCRPPTEAETKILQDELAAQLDRYTKDPEAAKKLLAVGASPRDEKLAAPELAAYTMIASTILNLDEMVTKP